MEPAPEETGTETSTGALARILSPLAFFLAHVVYLVLWSRDPFLTRWLEGSFSFFLALVACNVIRQRLLAAGRGERRTAAGDGRVGRDAP